MKHKIFSLEELIAPRSKGKVLVVVECVNFEVCDQPAVMNDLLEIYHLCPEEWEDFLDNGFLVIESEYEEDAVTESLSIIDLLRKEKFVEAVKATLMVDGVQITSTWDGVLNGWNLSESLPKPAKSVVIRFPVEKIKN